MNGEQGFSRRLRTAKRRARLSGRRLSAGEMSGMVRGQAESASQRLTAAKGLQLKEKGLTQTGELARERIASQEQMQTQQLGQQATQFTATQAQQAGQFGQTMEETALSREQQATLQGERLAAEKARQEAGITSTEKLHAAGIESTESIAEAGRLSQETMHGAGITSAEKLHAAGITSQEAMHAAGIMSAEEMHEAGIISAEELARLGREQEAGQFGETMGFREEELAEDVRQFDLLYAPPTAAPPMPHGLTEEMWGGMSEAERLAWLRRNAPGETETYTGHGPV